MIFLGKLHWLGGHSLGHSLHLVLKIGWYCFQKIEVPISLAYIPSSHLHPYNYLKNSKVALELEKIRYKNLILTRNSNC